MNQKILTPLIIGLVIGIVLGLALGVLWSLKGNSSNNNKEVPITDDILTNQTAMVSGKITALSSNKDSITIEDSTGKTASFTLNTPLMIVKQSATPTQASPSSNLKDIPLNETVLIYLRKMDGQYKVISISALSQNVPTPPKKS